MGGRVLYVEDDDLMRGALSRTMEAAGFEVTATANGDQALAALQSDAPDPDVIVLDLVMPKVDGWEFLGMAREDALIASIPLIVTTSSERSVDLLPADVVVLRKPFEAEDLLRALRAAIARGRNPKRA